MAGEGWDGKSLRQHVEGAGAAAGAARDLAESAHDEIATLRAELAEILEGQAEGFDVAETMSGSDAAALKSAGVFPKVGFVMDEVAAFRRFMLEREGVRAALREWQRLDAQLNGPRE